MLRRLYRKTLTLAASPHAPAWLALVAFAESSFFPVPPDVMLAPMVLSRPERAWAYAGICTAASVTGGIAGYCIGYFLSPVGLWLLAALGHTEGLEAFRQWYAHWGLWVILIKGMTPIPYKLVTIASGLAAFSFPMFMAASVITRGGRFFLAAVLIKRYGPKVEHLIEQRIYTIAGVVLAVAAVGFIAMRLIH